MSGISIALLTKVLFLGIVVIACYATNVSLKWKVNGLTRLKLYSPSKQDPLHTIYLHGSQHEAKVMVEETPLLTLVRATDGIIKYTANVKIDAEARRTGIVHLELVPTEVSEDEVK